VFIDSYNFLFLNLEDASYNLVAFVWVRNFVPHMQGRKSMRVFENTWRIFGPKREDVTAGRRKLHDEELHSLYSLSNILTRKQNIQSMLDAWERSQVQVREPGGKNTW
jgi:hypothetical protein